MGRRRDTTGQAGKRTPAALPSSIPAPYEAFSDSPNLVDTERNDLAACEAAIDNLRIAFWAAGKALQTIRDARLYRANYATFEDYVEDRWQMSRAYAYRLIQAWPLAEALSPIGDTTLNEGQVRALLPLATKHGQDAAVTVYGAVAGTEGVKVTAAVLADVVQQINDNFDPATAADQIRAYLTTPPEELEPEPADPAAAFTAEAARLRAAVTRTVSRPAFRTYARTHPEQARAVVTELRQLLDEIEAEALSPIGDTSPAVRPRADEDSVSAPAVADEQ